ncbi:endoglucanase (endo-1,4-beta-glucanase) (cellulase) [Planoprotostelium fungivorum]|uniref:Endoglucanase (Endo-1,4-beta-glucanase) (Cellulase) n=1 Tax=Planoprotostelium fungivorum TaxID=1890364 RepID=A0A2P6MZZ1_9EUKA|nr:endoglucanase (endo-1,4-beta-glucanase) (cellulase) [Planoprotostelium fungivorum]
MRLMLLLCCVSAGLSLSFRGVNQAGAEFASSNLPGKNNQDYAFPSISSIDWFVKRGVNVFRIPFLWERIQPVLDGPFDASYLSLLDATVNHTTQSGAFALIDPHNYIRYRGTPIGQGDVTYTIFQKFWKSLASRYASNQRVIFGLMNEPHDVKTEVVRTAMQAGIDGIRSANANQLILVPGNAWTGAHSWFDNWYGTPNSQVMLNITDPINNFAYDIHQYFDSDNSGTHTDCRMDWNTSKVFGPLTQWLRQNKARAFLSEFGFAQNTNCYSIANDTLNAIEAGGDVWIGWTYWAAGPMWGDYMYTVEPNAAGNSTGQWENVLSKYIRLNQQVIVSPTGTSTLQTKSEGNARTMRQFQMFLGVSVLLLCCLKTTDVTTTPVTGVSSRHSRALPLNTTTPPRARQTVFTTFKKPEQHLPHLVPSLHTRRNSRHMRFLFLCLIAVATAATASGSTNGTYSLTSRDGFQLSWYIDLDNETIYFNMTAPTTGWLSIGWNDGQGMAGADMAVGWVTSSTTLLYDCISSGNSLPPLDVNEGGSNDIQMYYSDQSASSTTIGFKRKLNTGDKKDYIISDKGIYFLYAWGSQDGTVRGSSIDYRQHDGQGTLLVNFFDGSVTELDSLKRPGVILAFVALGALLIYAISRWSYIFISRRVLHNTSDVKSFVEVSKAPRLAHIHSVLDSWLYRRIPHTDIALMHALVFIVYIFINVATLFFDLPIAPDSFGTLIAANAMLAVIPATRNSILVVLTGIPFDRAVQFHRWVGRLTVIIATVHVVYTFVDWRRSGESIIDMLRSDITNIWGLVAWVALLIMLFSSFEIFRRRLFEVFYTVHFSFLIFFVFGCLHNARFIPFAASAAAIYFIDRAIRFTYGMIPRRVTSTTVKDSNHSIVQFKFTKNRIAKTLGLYSTGQYVFVNFPSVSLFQWHPFSLTSPSDALEGEINVRASGGFTRQLVLAAQNNPKMMIRVDGPYGHLNVGIRRYPVVLLFCGGIGITPVLSVLRDLFCSIKDRPSMVEYVHVYWSIQSEDQYKWFAEELSTVTASSGDAEIAINVIVTRQEKVTPPFTKDRINGEFVDNVLNDVTIKHPLTARYVFACGPKGMVQTIWDKTSERKSVGERFDYHKETYEF